MLKSGQYPNIAIEAGTDPAEVMREHGRGEDTRDGVDSREKLETDILFDYLEFPGDQNRIFAYLDRQAAITRAECKNTLVHFAERLQLVQNGYDAAVRDMQPKVDELEAERDALKAKLETYGKVPDQGEREESHSVESEDTRETLEADLREWIDIATYKAFTPERMLEVMSHWLDRQDAITTAYCTSEDESCCEACRAAQKREIAELTAERDNWANCYDMAIKREQSLLSKVDELTDERNEFADELKLDAIALDELRKQVDELTTERDQLKSKVDELNDNWRKANDGWAEANAEAEQWRQKRDQLSRDLDAEHALVVQFEYDNENQRATIENLREGFDAAMADLEEALDAAHAYRP